MSFLTPWDVPSSTRGLEDSATQLVTGCTGFRNGAVFKSPKNGILMNTPPLEGNIKVLFTSEHVEAGKKL